MKRNRRDDDGQVDALASALVAGGHKLRVLDLRSNLPATPASPHVFLISFWFLKRRGYLARYFFFKSNAAPALLLLLPLPLPLPLMKRPLSLLILIRAG